MQSVTIRELAAHDLDLFHQMLAMFGEAFEDVETYTGAPPSDDYIRRLLGGGGFIAVVAIEDGAVIGGLAAYVLRKFERERSEVFIYDLAVASQHRRRGIATGLIDHLKTLAAARGAYVMFIQADQGDEPAIALYTKLGTREDVLHFDIATAGNLLNSQRLGNVDLRIRGKE